MQPEVILAHFYSSSESDYEGFYDDDEDDEDEEYDEKQDASEEDSEADCEEFDASLGEGSFGRKDLSQRTFKDSKVVRLKSATQNESKSRSRRTSSDHRGFSVQGDVRQGKDGKTSRKESIKEYHFHIHEN